jgi:hypothetical protein
LISSLEHGTQPLKELPEFEAYREAERSLQRVIAARFGLAPEQPAGVTEADRECFGLR